MTSGIPISGWSGPHDWPEVRRRSTLDDLSGVYLWTVENQGDYVVYGCGVTKRSVRQRMNEHRREMLRGKYTLFNLDAMKCGVRDEIWHGLWAGHDSAERKTEFVAREQELQSVAVAQMEAFKIYVWPMEEPRMQQRMEAAIMNALYAAPAPFCDLPDQGMFLAPRRVDEQPVVVNMAPHNFINLPERIEI